MHLPRMPSHPHKLFLLNDFYARENDDCFVFLPFWIFGYDLAIWHSWLQTVLLSPSASGYWDCSAPHASLGDTVSTFVVEESGASSSHRLM